MSEERQVRLKHARTGMYAARLTKPKTLSARTPCAGWRWVWKPEDASVFAESDTVHPIIQMNMNERDVLLEDAI